MSEADELEQQAMEAAPLELAKLIKRPDAPLLPGSPEQAAYAAFKIAATALKTAEADFKQAQRAYADAVAKLSEMAVQP